MGGPHLGGRRVAKDEFIVSQPLAEIHGRKYYLWFGVRRAAQEIPIPQRKKSGQYSQLCACSLADPTKTIIHANLSQRGGTES